MHKPSAGRWCPEHFLKENVPLRYLLNESKRKMIGAFNHELNPFCWILKYKSIFKYTIWIFCDYFCWFWDKHYNYYILLLPTTTNIVELRIFSPLKCFSGLLFLPFSIFFFLLPFLCLAYLQVFIAKYYVVYLCTYDILAINYWKTVDWVHVIL